MQGPHRGDFPATHVPSAPADASVVASELILEPVYGAVMNAGVCGLTPVGRTEEADAAVVMRRRKDASVAAKAKARYIALGFGNFLMPTRQ